MNISRNISRYSAARETIMKMLREPDRFKDSKLPSEDELSRIVGFSVGTVREALRMMEMEGVISKKHGRGNFIHQSALDLEMRIDLIADFSKLLSDSGYEASISRNGYTFRSPNRDEVESFGMDEEILSFDQIYLADGKNAIFTRNLVPRRFLTAELNELKKDNSLMELLWIHCHEKISNSVEKIIPRFSNQEEMKIFCLEKETAIITLDEIFYSYKDTAIGYACVSFNPEIMKLNMLRKWY